MRILILGATGYVGRRVAAAMVAAGHAVEGVVRTRDRAADLPAGVAGVLGDIGRPDTVLAAARAADVVVNVAFPGHGADWPAAVATEQAFHEALIAGLADSGKTIIVSNGTVFLGDSGIGRLPETADVLPDHPASIRAMSTQAALQGNDRGLRVVELRLASFVYGHGGSVFLPRLIAAARRTGRSIYVGDGTCRTSAVHVDAAARAYVDVLEQGQARGVFHIAADEEPAIRDIAEAVSLCVGNGCRVESVTKEEAAATLDPFTAQFLTTNNRLDSAKARHVLGWSGGHVHSLLWDVAHGSYSDRAPA